MKLRALALNQFKKFTRPMELRGIDDGLNVVVGPNEMGKSTLLDALRAVLFEKHGSRAQPIRALQNDRNQAGPVVELDFELGDGLYRITKRFIKKPYARLDFPDGRTFEGDEAEGELRGLLGFTESGQSGAKPETLGMWNVLWVKQGQSFGALDLPESARSNLHGALESEVGTVLGGRRGRALPQTIEKQLGKLVNARGKPRGEYKAAAERVSSLRNELGELEERRNGLSGTLGELEESLEKLEHLSDTDRDEKDREELDKARRRLRKLTELKARLETAKSDLRLKDLNLEQAVRKDSQRRDLKESVAAEENSLETAKEKLEEVREQEKRIQSGLEESRNAVREAETTVEKTEEAVRRETRVLGAAERKAQIDNLRTRLGKAGDAENRQRDAQQRAAAILVTDEAVERIRAAEKKLETAANRLDAVATRVTFDIEPERLPGVEIDGAQLTADQPSVRAVELTTITIPQVGRIIIEPAVKNRDKLLGQRHKAEIELKDALNEAGVSTVKEAEDLCQDRRKALQEAELARQEAELHSPPADEYEAGANALADYIEGRQQILENEVDELGLREPPELEEAETALRSARDQAYDAQHALENAQVALSGPQEALNALQRDIASAEIKHEDSKERLENLRSQLEKAENECPDDELRSRVEAARADLSAQKDAVVELEATYTHEELPQLEARVNRLEKVILDRREKRQNLEVDISGLKSRVETLEGAGLDEAIERKKRELELCEEEHGRFKREREILDLLLQTLRDAERAAKERYLSPVLNRLRPYLRLLFPGADITIDGNLQIAGVVREAGYEESFEHLSMGTQEQIAVLVRLAFAEMLVEQEQPATVVLDDALVFSDDTRMSRMFDILNVAARNVQVLILTCREHLFDGLGGRQLSLRPGNPEDLMSA